MDTDSEDSMECTSDVETVNSNTKKLLPPKSLQRYELAYKHFISWRQLKNTESFSENLLMEYFKEILEKVKPSTLWTQYSMLRSTLSIHDDVDITKYLKLKAFLKQQSDGYLPKKSKTLTMEEIKTFLNTAPDNKFLFTKVALIIGISGACRKQELCQLKIDDIKDLNSAAIFSIKNAKTKKPRTFTITGNFYDIYKKYAQLRPPNINETRFFLNYQHEKCTKQPVGINKIGAIPKNIATYLNLENPKLYTGHCFRRSSATIGKEDYTTWKTHKEQSSIAVIEGFLNESIQKKIKIGNTIVARVTSSKLSSSQSMETVPTATISKEINIQEHTSSQINLNTQLKATHPINLINCNNNVININYINDVKRQ